LLLNTEIYTLVLELADPFEASWFESVGELANRPIGLDTFTYFDHLTPDDFLLIDTHPVFGIFQVAAEAVNLLKLCFFELTQQHIQFYLISFQIVFLSLFHL